VGMLFADLEKHLDAAHSTRTSPSCRISGPMIQTSPSGNGEEATAYNAALSLTDASVAAYWRPSRGNFLNRISCQQLLAIGSELLGEQWAHSRAKDKKGALVDQLDRAFSSPEKQGRTPEQAEKLRSWLPAGSRLGALSSQPTPLPFSIQEPSARASPATPRANGATSAPMTPRRTNFL
jgi:hypothetical protein